MLIFHVDINITQEHKSFLVGLWLNAEKLFTDADNILPITLSVTSPAS